MTGPEHSPTLSTASDNTQQAPELISVGAQSLVENAKRLGLTWTMTLATVTEITPVIKAIVDGDTVAIGMNSMIGSVTVDQRIYVIQVPPAGNFIVGTVSGTYRARQTLTATTTATSVTFSTIPSTLRVLHIHWTARSDAAVASTSVLLRVNSAAGAVYNYQFIQGQAALAPTSAQGTAVTSIVCGVLAAATSTAGVFSGGDLWMPGWSSPHAGSLGVNFLNQAQRIAGGVGNITIVGGGEFVTAGPYTSITLLSGAGNFVAGSDFQLEGTPS